MSLASDREGARLVSCPRFTSSSGRKSVAGANVMPSRANVIDDGIQQRVVATIFFRGGKVRIKRADGAPVGQVLEPGPRLKQQELVDLAGHRHMTHAVAAKKADRAPILASPTQPKCRSICPVRDRRVPSLPSTNTS